MSEAGTVTDPAGAAPVRAYRERPFRVMVPIWLVISAGYPLFYFLAGPHMPPGTLTSSARGQQFDFNVLMVLAMPVLFAIWVYMGYAVFSWRASRGGPDPVAGPHSRGHIGVQVAWMAVTTTLVMSLFVFGTYELVVPAGAGGGEGPNPAWTLAGKDVLPVQVIGQQWQFTFRYPTYGGFESPQLIIPADTSIAFHVTSLDVIHSFWAYQLGVKADADPATDNVAYTKTSDATGTFSIRCSELCGLWHGAMFTTGKVESQQDFKAWAQSNQVTLAAATKLLPPFAWTYLPDANGADGGYYPDSYDAYSNVETYGSQKATP